MKFLQFVFLVVATATMVACANAGDVAWTVVNGVAVLFVWIDIKADMLRGSGK